MSKRLHRMPAATKILFQELSTLERPDEFILTSPNQSNAMENQNAQRRCKPQPELRPVNSDSEFVLISFVAATRTSLFFLLFFIFMSRVERRRTRKEENSLKKSHLDDATTSGNFFHRHHHHHGDRQVIGQGRKSKQLETAS